MIHCLRGSKPCVFPLAGVTADLVEAVAMTPTLKRGFLLLAGFPFPKLKHCIHLVKHNSVS